MKKSSRSLLAVAAGLTLALGITACSNGAPAPEGSAAPDAGAADGFPERPIEFIVPYDPGGSSDTTARVFSEALAAELEGTINVINRPGGGTVIGMTEAAGAKPDGYTLTLLPGSSFVTAPLTQEVPFGPEDFVSIASLMEEAFVLLTHPDSGIASVDDFDPQTRYTFVSYGPAHPSHLTMANLFDAMGVEGEGIPFTSATEAVQATASGQVDVGLVQISIALPQIEAGTVVPIAVTAREPLPALPKVPTLDAAGYPEAGGYLAVVAFGAPAGLPEPILATLVEAADRAYNSKAYQEYVSANHGITPAVTGPAWLEEWVPEQQKRARADVERLGLLG